MKIIVLWSTLLVGVYSVDHPIKNCCSVIKMSTKQKLKSLLYVTISGIGAFGAISIYKGDDKFYRNLLMPAVHLIDPESSHKLAVFVSRYRLLPKSNYVDPPELKVRIFNKEFPNPIGIAAGFDKNCEAVLGLKDVGFGFIEIGSVTPIPQLGNEKPRVFRLPKDLAVINRYGFNSEGHEKVFESLSSFRKEEDINELCVGVNLGKNKTSPDPTDDYVKGIQKFGPIADYLVINISSPNTAGLRNMQDKDRLFALLTKLVQARNNLVGNKPPLLLKLAPDLSYDERKDIVSVIMKPECRVDGLIVCNTTVERRNLQTEFVKNEPGGLSGKPLKDVSTKMIADMYQLTKGMLIIGVGGISSGMDAYEKIKAGASVVQIYTALVYDGPPVVKKIKRELVDLLKKDGYSNVTEAVGKDVRL